MSKFGKRQVVSAGNYTDPFFPSGGQNQVFESLAELGSYQRTVVGEGRGRSPQSLRSAKCQWDSFVTFSSTEAPTK